MHSQVEIVRLEDSTNGTLGALRVRGRVLCCTLEPPSLDNRQFVSSIPAGEYHCQRTHSQRFGNTFEVRNVPGRSRILFHPGNTVEDTSGCVLLGRHFGSLQGRRAVLRSRDACRDFLHQFQGCESFWLHIHPVTECRA